MAGRRIVAAGVAVSALAMATTVQGHALQDQPGAKAMNTVPADDADTSTTVVVTGKTPPVIHKADRTVYDLKDNPQAATGNLSDVLNTLPSVNATPDGNVTIRGQGSVQILIDGKPATAMKGANRANSLQSLPANTVSKIEVVTNPGAQYQSNSAAVINIITKQSQKRGAAGDLTVNAGPENRFNAAVNGNWGLGKLTLNGGLSFRQDGRSTVSHTDRTHSDADGAPLSVMQEDYRLVGSVRVMTLDAGLAYAVSDKDSLSLSGQLSKRRLSRHITDRIHLYDGNNVLTSDTLTTSAGPEDQDSSSLNMGYKHKGSREGETFNLSLRHEEFDPFSDRSYSVRGIDDLAEMSAYRIMHSGHQLTDELSGDYVLPLSGDRQWTAGFDYESSRDQSYNYTANINLRTQAETADDSQTNGFLIEQTLSASYVTYQMPVGPWSLQGGLRVENMLTRLRESRLVPYTEISDVQWSPSLYFNRQLTDDNAVKVSYSRRIERPTAYDLNPVISNTGSQDFFIGNPYLKPAEIQSLEAGYSHSDRPFSYEATLYYRRNNNSITDYSYFLSNTVLVSTRENAGKGSAGGLDMSLDANPTAKISYSLSADVFYNELEAFISDVQTKHSGMSYESKASFTYRPRAFEDIQLSVQSYGRILTAQGTQSGFTLVNLSYSRQLTQRLKLIATGYNILDTGRYTNITQTSQLRDQTRARFQGQIFYIGLGYKLGAAKADE
ncbi:MAG: TonB-dependent receptor [Asticcacaulis sp.]|uniref:TonB-dependent receptor n=1 Tax=Asticcacaulis sp. TaxID=1872648 RepID=UPI0039E303C0